MSVVSNLYSYYVLSMYNVNFVVFLTICLNTGIKLVCIILLLFLYLIKYYVCCVVDYHIVSND